MKLSPGTTVAKLRQFETIGMGSVKAVWSLYNRAVWSLYSIQQGRASAAILCVKCIIHIQHMPVHYTAAVNSNIAYMHVIYDHLKR